MTHARKGVLSHLSTLDITDVQLHHNLSPSEYGNFILKDPSATRTSLGAISVKTGKFTGRSPKDRFIVKDSNTEKTVDWGKVNQAISPATFHALKKEISAYLSSKEVFVHDAYVCADKEYNLNVRTIAEKAFSALFASNMFRNMDSSEIEQFMPDWTILCAPDFHASSDYTELNDSNFAILNFSSREIIIGGTAYTGEIKKSIFSVLNYILPLQHHVLSMHCSANLGKDGNSAIFFGLSGTGKTTLSADPERLLIGDDEHGWGDNGIFNFEGGCYAKTINLSPEGEPQIYKAIKPGALVENVGFIGETNEINFNDDCITENTRVSYPLSHIAEAKSDSIAGHPKHIFFLTCDAFGILPPLSKLTKAQAMYYFISGYTAKIAGTELGITEPQATFSACFGSPFLPLPATTYATMLGEKIEAHQAQIWLVNTGWTGGAYGEGSRISLKYTRALISAVLDGKLSHAEFQNLEGFDLAIPTSCDGVPKDILNPRNTWKDPLEYDEKSAELIELFQDNFNKNIKTAGKEILEAQPKLLIG